MRLVSAKARALLAYLAINGRSFSRAALATLLWGDLPDADARRNLRVEVMKLRQAVGDYLVSERQMLTFNRDLPYWLDAEQVEADIGLETAVSLFRGDLLEDLFVRHAPLFETWVEQERSRLNEKRLTLTLQLAQQLAQQQQYAQAVAYVQHVLTTDPTHEAAHRQLIRLFALQGNRSAALSQFETCRTVLAAQLGLDPSPETIELIAHIRQNNIQLPTTTASPSTKPSQHPIIANPSSVSPFIAGPPITDPRRFFGRERIVRRLFGLLRQRPLQNAAIIGPRRSGKTSLLHYVRQITTAVSARSDQRTNWLSQPERYRWIFVDFQDPRLGTEAGLLRHLLTEMGLPVPEPCHLDSFLDLVSEQLTTPTVVLLDEIGVALARYPELDDAFWESLRSLATNQVDGNLAFILTSHERPEVLAQNQGMGSPFFNIFGYTATLGPLGIEQAQALINSAPIPFASADSSWILEKSGRWPILLQILCRERLLALEEGLNEWQAEAWEQAQPFAATLLNQ